MSVIVLEKAPKSSAAGSYLGYSLQQLRACYHLFHASDEAEVSLEYVDDVAVHRADGTMLLEQAKSALSSNPLTDKSEELWKTLANWATLCVDHGVDPSATTFRLYVSPAKTSGSLVKLMHAADTIDAGHLIKKIQELKEKSPACAPHVERFLKAGSAICTGIIAHFSVETDEDPLENLLVFARLFVPDAPSEFASACIGLAHGRLDKLARARKPAVLSSTVFREIVRSLAAGANLRNLVSTPDPTADAIEAIANQNPLFLRQLKSVDLSSDLIRVAISDYLRTAADKTFWGESGRILEVELDAFDSQLLRHYTISRDEIEDVHRDLDEKGRGRRLYYRCLKSEAKLGELAAPEHFIAGEYNHLAEGQKVGWHPNHLDLFPPGEIV